MTIGRKLYDLVNDGEKIPSDGIDEIAREAVPQNCGRQVFSSVLTKTGDQLSKPGLILTWLLSSLGAPSAAIGLLVPIREAGSLLPQMAFSNLLRRYEIRKGFWITGSFLQGVATLGMGAAALTLRDAAAGWTIIALLVVFSLSRGICSIVGKDLLGKTIPKTRRGRLTGLASSFSGWIALGVGIFLAVNPAREFPSSAFAILLFVAGILWIAAAMLMTRLEEFPSKVTRDAHAIRDSLRSLNLLREDPVFSRFCIARALLASTVLTPRDLLFQPRRSVTAHRPG